MPRNVNDPSDFIVVVRRGFPRPVEIRVAWLCDPSIPEICPEMLNFNAGAAFLGAARLPPAPAPRNITKPEPAISNTRKERVIQTSPPSARSYADIPLAYPFEPPPSNPTYAPDRPPPTPGRAPIPCAQSPRTHSEKPLNPSRALAVRVSLRTTVFRTHRALPLPRKTRPKPALSVRGLHVLARFS
jgi:hypothetical protein